MGIRQSLRSLRHRGPPRAPASCIRLSEVVEFFPTAGCLEGERWRVPVHGRIYKQIESSRLRRAGLRLVNRLIGRKARPEGALPLFRARLGAFMADNERGNRIRIRVGEAVFKLKRSRASGHFQGRFEVPGAGHRAYEWLRFQAITRIGDSRVFEGRVLLLPPTGLSVISDIDDTIKVTEVLDRRRMLHNTFLEEYASVPEMAALYRRWAESEGAAFHYISASPWHLYPFLAEFLRAQDFPEGTWHLRDFRLMGLDLLRTLRPSRRLKARHARVLLRQFPQRRFRLVGDSGESDPQIYAGLAREFADQIERILIRNVTAEPASAERWRRVFAGLPDAQWQVYDAPSEIRETQDRR